QQQQQQAGGAETNGQHNGQMANGFNAQQLALAQQALALQRQGGLTPQQQQQQMLMMQQQAALQQQQQQQQQQHAGYNVVALRALAAKHGIPEEVSAQLPVAQLAAFLQNLQAQQNGMGVGAGAGAGVAGTPPRQPAGGAAQRPTKGVKREAKRAASKSMSRSPAPSQQGGSGLVSPTTPLTAASQRAGSQTPSDLAPAPTYSAAEVAAATRASSEFIAQLGHFTYETFLQFVQKFNRENSVPGNFSKAPLFNDTTIDMYRFFCEVVRHGGLEQVHVRRLWRQIARDIGLPEVATLPPLLSRWYKVWLQPLEQLRVFPPGHPRHTGVGANFSIKKRRKNDGGSPGATPAPEAAAAAAATVAAKRMRMHSPAPVAAAPGPPAVATPVPLPVPVPVAAPGAEPAAQTSGPAVTVPMPRPAPAGLQFFPLERTLDTFGGVDLQACVALRRRVRAPQAGDYGSIDVGALALSIESGIPAETTAALAALVRVSAHPDAVLPLAQCEELAEALLGVLERGAPGELEGAGAAAAAASYAADVGRLEAQCGELLQDEMHDAQAALGVARGGDALWAFTSEHTLAAAYALRNLSFLPANQQFLAQSADFHRAFAALNRRCAAHSRAGGGGGVLALQRALDMRRCLLATLANLASTVDLGRAGAAFAGQALGLLAYFADGAQAQRAARRWESSWVLVALDVLARMSVAEDGRRALAQHLALLRGPLDACARLVTLGATPPQPQGQQPPPPPPQQQQPAASLDMRAAYVLTSLLVVGNVAGGGGGSGGRRAHRRRMAFMPVAGSLCATDAATGRQRQRAQDGEGEEEGGGVDGVCRGLADDAGVVRALWTLAAGDALQGFGEVAERAVAVLGAMADAGAEFAQPWTAWVAERLARRPLPRATTLALCALVGLAPARP
ncbi:hypothetical protein LPJ53_004793, partial [Coemansia erecta]